MVVDQNLTTLVIHNDVQIRLSILGVLASRGLVASSFDTFSRVPYELRRQRGCIFIDADLVGSDPMASLAANSVEHMPMVLVIGEEAPDVALIGVNVVAILSTPFTASTVLEVAGTALAEDAQRRLKASLVREVLDAFNSLGEVEQDALINFFADSSVGGELCENVVLFRKMNVSSVEELHQKLDLIRATLHARNPGDERHL